MGNVCANVMQRGSSDYSTSQYVLPDDKPPAQTAADGENKVVAGSAAAAGKTKRPRVFYGPVTINTGQGRSTTDRMQGGSVEADQNQYANNPSYAGAHAGARSAIMAQQQQQQQYMPQQQIGSQLHISATASASAGAGPPIHVQLLGQSPITLASIESAAQPLTVSGGSMIIQTDHLNQGLPGAMTYIPQTQGPSSISYAPTTHAQAQAHIQPQYIAPAPQYIAPAPQYIAPAPQYAAQQPQYTGSYAAQPTAQYVPTPQYQLAAPAPVYSVTAAVAPAQQQGVYYGGTASTVPQYTGSPMGVIQPVTSTPAPAPEEIIQYYGRQVDVPDQRKVFEIIHRPSIVRVAGNQNY